MKIADILSQIDMNTVALPEFQRGYVWNRDQVRGLMRSLYYRYPVGGLLTWKTKGEATATRGTQVSSGTTVSLLLDGQQRMTSLYGVMRGKPPKFFDGNAKAFTGLYFNLDTEEFEFYAPQKMQNNPIWLNVTELYVDGGKLGSLGGLLFSTMPEKAPQYFERASRLRNIGDIDIHIEEIIGEDKTIEVVVDIFNKVNSGGTKLSSGDLALAKVCAEWPEAREEMQKALQEWAKAGFHFKLDWLMRVINAVVTGDAYFSALSSVSSEQFKQGLADAKKAVNRLLNLINSYLGLDSDQVLGSRYSFPLMARYVHVRGKDFNNGVEQQALLYWYIHTFLWGRYAGSTESVLARDLNLISNPNGALDRLIADLQRDRGDLQLKAADFEGATKGARFYPLLYMMTRVSHARDWGNGVELRNALLGNLSQLQVHHVFPQAQLKKAGYNRQQVNALANFTFLTQDTNLEISDALPKEYLPIYEAKHPGVLESHWMPLDAALWSLDQYPAFLAKRRELLAQAANKFLKSLVGGTITAPSETPEDSLPTGGAIVDDSEINVLNEVNAWLNALQLPEGDSRYELTSEQGEVLATLDLAWPNGLQEGLSQPVALLLDETDETHSAVNQAGYLYFTDVSSFKAYVERNVLAVEHGSAVSSN
ncbi:GmrSD restriction endonuclease domain-containing protein [Deinococcus arcticus]|uniref:GmrSD restriction endonucleases N-terminal domain-containing protein n=1 Tax=Deinococcus arcticus TaxID=2136176 RepID=A0A2T3W6V2_9DEIO|nr:DUF262 domain-containing protein [Deinococcus arcticus]PTA67628.1 hypothetical protein C8263_12050 [Deinococcus arcticus]